MSLTAKSFNPSNNATVDGIKGRIEELANYLETELPPSRRRSVALTHLETASMFAVKAIFYDDSNERTGA